MLRPPKKVTVHVCKRCKHEWAARLDRLPVKCARCRSPYWNKEYSKKGFV